MRAFSLLGLRDGNGRPLRFRPSGDGPLVIPYWFRAEDREQILDFYQALLAEPPMPRIEVDWRRGLLGLDAHFLQTMRDRRGSDECLVVVRISGEDVDLNQVLATREIAAFQFVAITSDHAILHERYGTLTGLVRLVMDAASDAYNALSDDFGLDAEAPQLLAPILDSLLNPVVVLDAFNAVVDIQGESLAAEQRGEALKARIIGRLLGQTPDQVAVALVAIAERGLSGLEEAIPKKPRDEIIRELRGRMLLRDEKLTRWARFLSEAQLRDQNKARLTRIREVPALDAQGLDRVLEWFGLTPLGENEFKKAVADVYYALSEGRLEMANGRLSELEPHAIVPRVGQEAVGDFWDAIGRLRMAEGRWPEAESAIRHALALLREGGASPVSLGLTTLVLARGLRANGRWPEAEPLYREALKLKEKGKDTATSRGLTMHELASGLSDNGQWKEAEPLFREALKLKEEGKDTTTSRANTMDSLARGLRDNGRWREAEPLFREALRLKEEGKDTLTSRGITMHELARGLRENGQWKEAEPLFHEALRLKEEGKDTPTSRGMTIHELALTLDDNGGRKEAEPLLREALRLKEEGKDTQASRGITMHELARMLRDKGVWKEAEPLFREALRLKEEGQGTLTSRGVTTHELAVGLRDDGRWEEAEPLFHEALRLGEEGKDSPASLAITIDEMAIGLRENGRVQEADDFEKKAAALRGAPQPGTS